MPLFSVVALDHEPNSMAKRDEHRDAHRAYVWDNDQEIRFVGPFLDEVGNQRGSFYIFESASEDIVREWLSREPFVANDVYREIIVSRFMIGKNELPAQGWPKAG